MAMFFEPTPTARLVTDLAPVYGSLLAYIILTVISLVLQLVLAGLTIANIKVSYAQSWFEAAPRRKIWVRERCADSLLFGFADIFVRRKRSACRFASGTSSLFWCGLLYFWQVL
jgi:hypothetical protein